ncbi:1,4-alpha-glucan branching protein GlgB [Paenibacillus pasadenensis]|uniref:1,4-alpha-glucan branching protein GlgB n=1 Tax=Paenibacillus pasadenensis TaxID=217090 RepID=UPI00204264F9|nr:1,4-alpha-glucan branching protein GlgB [Paenibacillus pasadenensis]MCM3747259.1 1,4-alpha-glucan branching protein GlgB [Paenibacillus pasadenensis]
MPAVREKQDKALLKDVYLFNRGDNDFAYRTFGAHIKLENRRKGVRFTVWAPNAADVGIVGDFNGWDSAEHRMEPVADTGVWTLFVPGLKAGDLYKYEIHTSDGRRLLKADPFAFASELRPGTASVVADLTSYNWKDEQWQTRKQETSPYDQPMLVYEMHMGTWKIKGPEIFYSYDEIGAEILDYVVKMGYTHIELMPLAEHPFDKSWGYQITGFFAPTARYGSAKSLMKFIDRCHRKGIGVILDWVPAHFCKDEQGLREFDGTPIFEGSDPRLAEKPLWGTNSFDYGRTEVQSFLISNALYWMDMFHIDGLRVDAVASMRDLTMDKSPEQQTRNIYGGTRNLDADEFLKRLNKAVFRYFPNTLMIAEDSSAEPGVTAPVHEGGLGFNFKWNMGWMNDMLRYMQLDPSERPKRHNWLTFAMMYAYSENFILPLSHDEVVHGKKSLLNKMPGSYEEKFAGLRAFYGFWMTHPGKKLLFMGGEFGQFDEWKDSESLDWMVLQYDSHSSMQQYVRKLNGLYRKQGALWEQDFNPEGFEWIDVNNSEQCVISFIRKGKSGNYTVTVANFSLNHYGDYQVGVPDKGRYKLLLHSDDSIFGGSSSELPARYSSTEAPMHGRDFSLNLHLPPLSFQLLEFQSRGTH